ncbi:MAG: hypothetical protein COV67_02485 [Nitrospinae bacterium CG11_big_fil_rev_8_21_14_0_20_56_8]|nr:MAG: hypothetical protein COV67_02485 [Nitrospinae bacterium CG11_big_fil_rev_8_21_14_0_20_56_8]
MKFKGTLWLILILAGLAAYYYAVDLPREEKEKKEKERSETVLPFQPGEVESFVLNRKDLTLALHRKGENAWELTKPLEAPGDLVAVDLFLDRLQSLKTSRLVEESAKDLAPFGLQAPSLTVSLKTKSGKELKLLVGDEHPMGSGIYMKTEADAKVLLVPASRNEIEKSVFAFRDKTLLKFEPDHITRIDIERQPKPLTLIKSGDQWRFPGEEFLKADPAEVRNFLDQVRREKIREFVDETPASLAPFNLNQPTLTLTLTAKEGEPPIKLLIGNRKEEQGYFAKTDDDPRVLLVPSSLVEHLSQKQVDFIDRVLADFNTAEATRLDFQSGDEVIRLVRESGEDKKWRLEFPIQSDTDTGTVNTLLADLREARIEEFVKTQIVDPVPFGLDRPKKKLTAFSGKEAVWFLELGNTTQDQLHQFARRKGEKAVFSLKTETVQKLFRDLNSLRDRKLLHFQTDEVNRIRLEYPKQTFELEKEGDDWNLVQPRAVKKIKAFLGNDTLWTLKTMEFDHLVSPSMDEAKTGLNLPAARITLWNAKGTVLGEVSIGKPVNGQPLLFARVEGNKSLYEIKKRFLDELPQNLEKFEP